VSATATLDNDDPVFILDVDEMLQRARITALQTLAGVATGLVIKPAASRKRILVVDDSITVRELERQMLTADGFDVAVAVDGLAGWNTLKNEVFDLVITDVDMPRLDGMQLVRMIRADETLQQLPVIMVSYIDREEDGQRAIAAGATRFVAKTSFHDDTLRRQVRELIGEAAV
jgi:two-component system sensor histidine kinase and response regulator WspE